MGSAFRRRPEETGVNALLNYGYAILRSATARALMGAGLHPTLGIHHTNRYNPMALADDFMEPLRPWVDWQVWQLHQQGTHELDRATKQTLAAMLLTSFRYSGGEASPLARVLERLAFSWVGILEGKRRELEFPLVEKPHPQARTLPENVTTEEWA